VPGPDAEDHLAHPIPNLHPDCPQRSSQRLPQGYLIPLACVMSGNASESNLAHATGHLHHARGAY
jgi:hypothetical protein